MSSLGMPRTVRGLESTQAPPFSLAQAVLIPERAKN